LIEKSETYVYGTAAKKIEYDVYEHNEVLKTKKKVRSNNKAKVKIVFMLMVVFCMFFLMMYRYAVITELNYDIARADGNYNKLKENNARLLVEIEKETDLRKIKEIAEEKLNMQKPDKFQTVYISVPKNDFTVVADAYKNTDKENTGVLSALLDKVSKFAQLLY